MNGTHRVFLALVILLLAVSITPIEAHAYGGPGSVISAIGTFLAVVAAVLASIFGFIWYPLKRLYRSMNDTSPEEKSE